MKRSCTILKFQVGKGPSNYSKLARLRSSGRVRREGVRIWTFVWGILGKNQENTKIETLKLMKSEYAERSAEQVRKN